MVREIVARPVVMLFMEFGAGGVGWGVDHENVGAVLTACDVWRALLDIDPRLR